MKMYQVAFNMFKYLTEETWPPDHLNAPEQQVKTLVSVFLVFNIWIYLRRFYLVSKSNVLFLLEFIFHLCSVKFSGFCFFHALYNKTFFWNFQNLSWRFTCKINEINLVLPGTILRLKCFKTWRFGNFSAFLQPP